MFQFDAATYALMRQRWAKGAAQFVTDENPAPAHVGGSMPYCAAWVRTGKIRRAFRFVGSDDVHAQVPGLGIGSKTIWQGQWEAATDYTPLPNLLEVELTTDFGTNGVTQATIRMDNVGMIQTSGVGGIYHQIERGYYAPLRGYRPPSMPDAAVGTQNDWFDILRDKSTEIIIVAGYGESAAIPVFKGLLNDNSLTAAPDSIAITARDFGQLLTDQQVFVNAKVQKVKDPITFADRLHSDDVEEIRGGVEASSHEQGHPPRLAIDENAQSHWRSRGNDHASAFEWLQMKIPHGRYETVRIRPEYKDQECYIALKPRDKNAPGSQGAKRIGGSSLPDNQWVDEGKGYIPNTNIPYIAHIENLKAKDATHQFPDLGYLLGDDSVIRLYFTNLSPMYESRDRVQQFRAGIGDFVALKRDLAEDAEEKKWILVDDAADIVKTVLQWCGLDVEWEIESTGVRLANKLVFNRGDKLIDIINRVAEMVNYVFYIKPPTQFDDDDLTPENDTNQSLGVPVFRQNQAMRSTNGLMDAIETVSEENLLTGIEANFTDEPLAYNIRVRGRRLKKKKGGVPLAGDKTRRAMYVYRPPWSRDTDPGGNWPDNAATNQYRNGNVKKYVVHHDVLLRDSQECEIAAMFIAFREALESAKATCEFPAMPSIHLDHQMKVIDTGTGIAARIWVTNRTLSVRLGENPHFKMAVGGSILDTPDINRVKTELNRSLRKKGYDPGLSEWEIKHHGDAYRLS